LALCFFTAAVCATPPTPVKLAEQVQAIGEVMHAEGVVTGKAAKSTLLIGPADGDAYRVTAELKLVDRVVGNAIQVMPIEPSDFQRSAALHATFTRDAAGVNLQASTYAWNGAGNKWVSRADTTWHYYWPVETDKRRQPKPIRHGKETMPRYAALRHKTGIPVPGTPTEIGTWIQGNSGWGRLIYELTDATGERWISIGAEQPGVPPEWVTDLTPLSLRGKWARPAINDWNCSDVFGWSRINFDDWRSVAFPLPGNYPGEKHPWSANSQWRWDKDGGVHYPLTFRRLIIELPEKMLHVKEFAPPPSRAIGLWDLTAGQDDRQLGYVLGLDR
jgi:hypothetical protein